MANKPKVKIPKEKWADAVHVTGCSPRKSQKIVELLRKKVDDQMEVSAFELPLSDDEIGIIKETITVLNLLRKKLGLDPTSFSLNRFHVLEQKDWDRMIAPHAPHCDAISLMGHCYFLYCKELKRFAFNLTHEIGHAASYLSVRVEHQKSGYHLTVDRYGLTKFRPKVGYLDYRGLNEGTTELVAINLRAVLEKISKILSEKEKIWLKNHNALEDYAPFVNIICDISDLIAHKEGKPMGQINMLLLKDYFTGSCDFLRLLRKYDSDAIKILRNMNDETKDAQQAAELLGLITPSTEDD